MFPTANDNGPCGTAITAAFRREVKVYALGIRGDQILLIKRLGFSAGEWSDKAVAMQPDPQAADLVAARRRPSYLRLVV